jgi:hypothetical protein
VLDVPAGAIQIVTAPPALLTAIVPATGSAVFEGIGFSLDGGTLLSPGIGSVSLAGTAPTLLAAEFLPVGAGSGTFAGAAPSLVLSAVVHPASVEINFSVAAPFIAVDLASTAPVASTQAQGYAPSVARNILLDSGTAVFSGLEADVTSDTRRPVPAVEINFTGGIPSLQTDLRVYVDTGSISVLPQVPAIVRTEIEVLLGLASISGHEPLVQANTVRAIAVPVGQLSIVGNRPWDFTQDTRAISALVVVGPEAYEVEVWFEHLQITVASDTFEVIVGAESYVRTILQEDNVATVEALADSHL